MKTQSKALMVCLVTIGCSFLLSSCYTTRTIPAKTFVYPSEMTLSKCFIDSFPVSVSTVIDAESKVKCVLTNNTENHVSVERLQFIPSLFKETNILSEIILSPNKSMVQTIGTTADISKSFLDTRPKKIEVSVRLSDKSYNSCIYDVNYTEIKTEEKIHTELNTTATSYLITLLIAIVAGAAAL